MTDPTADAAKLLRDDLIKLLARIEDGPYIGAVEVADTVLNWAGENIADLSRELVHGNLQNTRPQPAPQEGQPAAAFINGIMQSPTENERRLVRIIDGFAAQLDEAEAAAASAREKALEEAKKAVWKAIDPSIEGVARECADTAMKVLDALKSMPAASLVNDDLQNGTSPSCGGDIIAPVSTLAPGASAPELKADKWIKRLRFTDPLNDQEAFDLSVFISSCTRAQRGKP